jgi:hypothetical protein
VSELSEPDIIFMGSPVDFSQTGGILLDSAAVHQKYSCLIGIEFLFGSN